MAIQIKDRNTKQASDLAMNALRWLAARCDWATTVDGAGFSGVDAPLGHALAEKADNKFPWSQRETLAACDLIVKYKKQLGKGAIDISGVDALAREMEKALADEDEDDEDSDPVSGRRKRRLKKRDVVSGRIWVDAAAGRIMLQTTYHDLIVEACREMLGSRWDPEKKLWSANLCAENAADTEEIAKRWGIRLEPHAGWKSLVPVRKVERVGDRIVLRGVRAWAIIKSMPQLSGKPDRDELIFDAIEIMDQTSVAIPLRSWTIREALLWLANIERGDPNFLRLGWARDEVVSALQGAYPGAIAAERARLVLASAIAIPPAETAALQASLPPEVSSRLMPHQWVAVKAIREQEQIILADQQGLGKTIEILAALESVRAFPAVVIAPATALLNWRDEAVTWLPHRRVAVLGGGVGKRDQGVPLANADLVILNYESFGKQAEFLVPLRPKALVADEAQYLKGHDSVRTQAVKQFCREADVGRIIAASGTPVMNRPAELLTLLTLLPSVLAALGGFKRFASRYCRATHYRTSLGGYWDYGGAANLGELANRLRETGCFIRRDKATVLPGLVDKERVVLDVGIANRVEYEQAKENFNEWLKTKNIPRRRKVVKQKDEDESALASAAAWMGWGDEDLQTFSLDQRDRAEAIRRMGALRQLAGVGKIAAAVGWIRECVKDEKLVVFAYHIEVQQALIDALEIDGTPVLSITGDMAIKARQDAIKRFQSDPAARLIICSLKASQTAITLTAARRALMVELDWTPSALEQAEDRIHRIGQNGDVKITYLHAANTMDDRMVDILDAKRAKISVIGAANAPYGYRKDGVPRQQAAGPGRPRLAPDERERRRKSSKAGWQARNAEYMRDYMRQRRLKKKIKQVPAPVQSADRRALQREIQWSITDATEKLDSYLDWWSITNEGDDLDFRLDGYLDPLADLKIEPPLPSAMSSAISPDDLKLVKSDLDTLKKKIGPPSAISAISHGLALELLDLELNVVKKMDAIKKKFGPPPALYDNILPDALEVLDRDLNALKTKISKSAL